MQREKATNPFCVVVVVTAVVEEATLATPGEPPPLQPAASSEDAATTMTEARMSRRGQHMILRSFQSRAPKAHHRNLNVSAPRLRGC
jgi:hypothetical protein